MITKKKKPTKSVEEPINSETEPFNSETIEESEQLKSLVGNIISSHDVEDEIEPNIAEVVHENC